MANIQQYGLVEPIRAAVQSGKPFLGICLGLQVLFSESEEFGLHRGLDIIPGQVKRFRIDPSLKVPHMGWNAVQYQRPCPVFAGIADGAHWYFVHSYYVEPTDRSVAATMTSYGVDFVSAIWRDNIVACQFHPEKSQAAGLRLMKNFGAWK
jgi:glutamine amidotransferase